MSDPSLSQHVSHHQPVEPLTLVYGDVDADEVWLLAMDEPAQAAAACQPPDVAIYSVYLPTFLGHAAAPDCDLAEIFDKRVLIFSGCDASGDLKSYEIAAAFGRRCEDAGADSVRFVWMSGRLDKILEERDEAERPRYLTNLLKRTGKKPAKAKPADTAQRSRRGKRSPSDSSPRIMRWTDSGVAERWVDSVEGQWRWTSAGGFLAWVGHRWEERTEAEALEAMRQFAKDEVVAAVDDTTSDDAKDAVKRLDARQLKAALSLSRGQIVADLASFDQDPDIAVAPNGVIDLATGDLLEHDSARLVTKSCGVDYVPGATHPDWDQVLTSVPAEVADYIQVRFGQMLTGYVPDDDVMMVLRGGGENAKTTMLSAIRRAFGDYSVLLSDKVLLGDTRDHSTELMPLRGSRMAYIEELPEARHLNTQRLKKIDGSEEVTARHVHRDNVTFRATWGLAISTNFDLMVEETDRGTWRRLQEIRYPFTYKKAHEALTKATDRHGDPRLRDAVREGREQQQAVLAWLVEGARRWYAADRTMPEPPEQVTSDTNVWRKLNDQVLAFAEDRLVADPTSAVWINDLQSDFGEWLRGRGHNAWAMPKLRARFADSEWLKDKGVYFTGRVRRDPTEVSRPEALPGGPLSKALPAQGQFLVGVRYRNSADDSAEVAMLRAESGAHDDARREYADALAAYRADMDAWRQLAESEAGVSPEHVDQHAEGLRNGYACRCRSVTRPAEPAKARRRASGAIDKRLSVAWERCYQLGLLPEGEVRDCSSPIPEMVRAAFVAHQTERDRSLSID